jgi:hypothetical protein
MFGDVLQEPNYELPTWSNSSAQFRCSAKGILRGVITILKTEVEPFTDKQIELVETFADQPRLRRCDC